MSNLSRLTAISGFAAGLVLVGMSTASAQTVIGPVSWQLQPYCNIVTLTLVSTPAGFTLDGTDDQCGAINQASAVGIASPNATGNFTLNFTIVTATSAKPVHVSAVVSPANGNGTWTDSVGNAGTFAFFGATPGLPPRPLPASGLAANVITTVEIASGAVGASDINPAEVQMRVTGACGAGQVMIGVNANGSVTCSGTARSGQVLSGQLSAVTPANASFMLVAGSYPLPLPPGTAQPVLEYRAAGTPSATCPGIGQSTTGRLCIYAYNTSNISTATYGGGLTAQSRLYGFSLDVFKTASASEGYLIANWAYQVP